MQVLEKMPYIKAIGHGFVNIFATKKYRGLIIHDKGALQID